MLLFFVFLLWFLGVGFLCILLLLVCFLCGLLLLVCFFFVWFGGFGGFWVVKTV